MSILPERRRRTRAEVGMFSGWLTRRAVARIAIAGLAVGLAALATLTIWSTAQTQSTTARVRAYNRISAHWRGVFTHLSAEDAALREFLATGGTDYRRQPLVDVVGSAEHDLVWLERNGGTKEREYVRTLRIEYAGYSSVIRDVLDLSDPTMLSGYAELATLHFAPLRDRIVANVDRNQNELTAYLTGVDHRNTQLRWFAVAVVFVDFILCAVSSVVLVGYQRRAERESANNRYKALHDSLTGLANRQLLAEQTERAVAEARRANGITGLLLIDLDRFKDVNDTLGHHSGDLLLKRVAERLTDVSRQTDTVARLGGDEFAVLLHNVASVDDIAAVAERVRRRIQEPVELDGLTVDFGASIGAAAFPVDCEDAEGLLQHADVAMYVAKRGGFGVSVYNPGKDENDPASLSVLSELRRGIDRGELVLFYQPKVDAVTLRPLGVEALVRWQHPNRGLLPPGAFLPLIEPTEFIEQLTDTVLRMAVDQAREWDETGRRLPIAVNITARSLLDSAFPVKVAGLLEEYGVPADLLTLELTESALITAPGLASEALRQLRARGIKASIDDFGTGYSSMAFLRDMPVHELKIDRSFVTTMRTDDRNLAIVSAMVDLGKNLSLQVVAEGVEDEETLVSLAELGCRLIQGYHISKPLSVTDLNTWLDNQPTFAPVM